MRGVRRPRQRADWTRLIRCSVVEREIFIETLPHPCDDRGPAAVWIGNDARRASGLPVSTRHRNVAQGEAPRCGRAARCQGARRRSAETGACVVLAGPTAHRPTIRGAAHRRRGVRVQSCQGPSVIPPLTAPRRLRPTRSGCQFPVCLSRSISTLAEAWSAACQPQPATPRKGPAKRPQSVLPVAAVDEVNVIGSELSRFGMTAGEGKHHGRTRRGRAARGAARLRPPAETARGAADLTQEELAERASVSVRSISDLERGSSHIPRRDTVLLLAEGLRLRGTERDRFIALARGRSPAAAQSGARRAAPRRRFPTRRPRSSGA